jgi:hypothetical protein
MIRDDLEACLQAYRFAELLLAGWRGKPEKEQAEALAAAQRLRDEVEPRYTAAMASLGEDVERATRLKGARERADQLLDEVARRG